MAPAQPPLGNVWAWTSCMKNTRTEALISGNKLICTLYSGVFLEIIFLEIFRFTSQELHRIHTMSISFLFFTG